MKIISNYLGRRKRAKERKKGKVNEAGNRKEENKLWKMKQVTPPSAPVTAPRSRSVASVDCGTARGSSKEKS